MKKVLSLSVIGLALLGVAAAASPGVGSDGWGGALLGALLPVLLTGVGAGTVALLGYASRYLRGKTKLVKNERLAYALDLLTDFAFEKVRQLSQESVALLKAASADGRLTTAEAQAAAATAAREVWTSLPEDLRKLFVRLAGNDAAAIDTYVRPKIEVAVNMQAPIPYVPGTVNLGLKPAPRIINGNVVDAARARIGL